jgi:cytochrome c-type biogenesis protein CcmH
MTDNSVRGRVFAGLTSRVGIAALAVLVAGLIALIVVAVRGEPPPATIAQQAHQIETTLRCPICEDLSVADSPAPLAGQMRTQINQDLKAGKTATEIRAKFVAAYGESVLLSPPHQGIGQLAYVLPFAVLAAGLVPGILLLRRGRRRTYVPARGRPTELSLTDRDRLADALARSREEEP